MEIASDTFLTLYGAKMYTSLESCISYFMLEL